MIRDDDLHERLHEASAAYAYDVDSALDALGGTVRARKRQRIGAAALAFAVALVLVAVGWSISTGHGPHVVPAGPGMTVPSEPPVKITPPPPGVVTKMTVAKVESIVLAQIASDERRLGKVLVPARIVAVTYLPGGPSWAVEFEGTHIVCGSLCSAHPGGVIVIDDGSGSDSSETLRAPICEARAVEGPPSPNRRPGAVVNNARTLPPC